MMVAFSPLIFCSEELTPFGDRFVLTVALVPWIPHHVPFSDGARMGEGPAAQPPLALPAVFFAQGSTQYGFRV